MKILLLLPLLLGFSVPAIAHNEFNGGDAMHRFPPADAEEGEGAETEVDLPSKSGCGDLWC